MVIFWVLDIPGLDQNKLLLDLEKLLFVPGLMIYKKVKIHLIQHSL